MKQLVSIIIPTYNRAHLIGETLDSVLVQTYNNWECIIVDDVSADNTFDVVTNYLKKDDRFKYLVRPIAKIKGPSACRNIGLANAQGEFILFLDSDDIIADFCLEERVKFALKHKDNDFWIFKTQTFKDAVFYADKIFNLKLLEYNNSIYLKLFFKGKYPFCIMGPLWQNESLKIINGFDENLNVFEDPDLHIRAFLNNLKSKTNHNSKPDSFYRLNNDRIKEKAENEYLEKTYNSAYIFFEKYLRINKSDIKDYASIFFKNEILGKANILFIKFYRLYFFYNIFTLRQIFFLPILFILKKLKLNNKKGFGYYRIYKLIYPSKK